MILTSHDAHGMRWPAMVWAHFSQARHTDFDERVAAAAAAGFSGIGLFVGEYERLRTTLGRSPRDIADVLDAHGMTIAEIEVARGWWAMSGPVHDDYQTFEQWVFEIADHFGSRYLQLIGGTDVDPLSEQSIDQLGDVADRCAEHGLDVGIEFLPFTNISDASIAQRLVHAVDRPNLGYCVDIWHHVRGVNDMDLITALEPERIFSVQMSDGPLLAASNDPADYKSECLASRVPPGSGEFDCVGFVRTLAEMGVTAPFSIEVCNAELWAAPAAEVAKMSADGMRAVIAEASR